MARKDRAARGERLSALWGTSKRGRDLRGNALRTTGGRGAAVLLTALLAMVAPWSAAAGSAGDHGGGPVGIPEALLAQARANPSSVFRVIVQGETGESAPAVADTVAELAAQADLKHGRNSQTGDTASAVRKHKVTAEFSSISSVAVELTGEQLAELAAHGGDGLLAITPDAPVKADGTSLYMSSQAWPAASGVASNWAKDGDEPLRSTMPSIAVVDSGIADRADFAGRLVASVDLSSLPDNSPGDGNGHGTFVAGIAAGAAGGYAGAAPAAKLVSIDVMDDHGMGLTSDVIRACEWILEHKAQYDIRVANFSLHSDLTAPFDLDPLDRAVEQLWLNGIVVVTAAGNYASNGAESGVVYSPADDPFVITVGGVDLGSKATLEDDTIAPWSAWGSTLEGFAKPDLSAPGRYMISAVPAGSTLVSERPESVTAPGYIQLSGTSFAAPVVSGTAADMIARHPELTPDQVKGALMLTARPMDKSVGPAGGIGELTADKATDRRTAPNPNAGLEAFVVPSSDGSGLVFDGAAWRSAASSSASWNSASWNSASWDSASWDSASWNSASWNSASWNSASWDSASWDSASWNSASWNSVSWNSATLADAADRDDVR